MAASDLEEGEIVEEGEEVRRGNNGQGTKTSARATSRKTRKKSVGGRSASEKQKTVRNNGLGVSVAQDLHRQRKIRRDAPPRRHVATLHESSREKIVISVNSRSTRSTNRSCDKQVPDHAERRNRAVHSREPIRRNWGNGQRNEEQRQTSRWRPVNRAPSPPLDEGKEIIESSDDDNASVISVPVPPKTPPPLIVLEDSDEEVNNDEDVEVLQLRKAALEGLMAKLGREARESAAHLTSENKEEDEPYSPPDDDFHKAQNIENIFPDGDQEKTEFPSVHQPPASFLPLREPNQYNMLQEIRSADNSNQEVVASSSSFTATTTMYTSTADRLYPPLGTGDVDMRLISYPTNIPVASEPNFVPPNRPVVSQPEALVQYPLFHTRGNGCYGGNRMVPAPVMPPNVPFGFGNPTMPGYNVMNNYMDTRPWQQLQPVQQNVATFGFPCPVPSPHIVLPTPNFGSNVMEPAASLLRVTRPTVFPEMVPPRPLIQSSSDAPNPLNLSDGFKNDVDDRSTILLPKQMSISPPSSPPPEEVETPASPAAPEVIPTDTPPRENSPKAKQQKPRSRNARSRRRSRRRAERRTESNDSRTRRSSSRRTSGRSRSRKHSSSPAARRHSSQRSRGQEQEARIGEVVLPEELRVSVPAAKEELLEGNIVISVCNENAVPPPPVVVEVTHADDSMIEDEDMLRAKLLLELAKKKQITEALVPPASTSSTTTTTVASSTKPIADNSAATAAVPKASLVFPFPLQGTGATITKTILNPRSKNRQIVRVVNNSSGISSFATRPNFGLRNTVVNNTAKPIRPNLHSIQRTVINTNLLKKNVYNQNADPLMRHVKITVPNKITPLIIPAGADSSTDDESSVEGSPAKHTKGLDKMDVLASRTGTAAGSQIKANSSAALPQGFEDSLNSLLRSSREQIKPSTSLPPLTLQHLPPEKQAEYLRLKSQLEHYHRLIEKKKAKKEAGSNVSISIKKSALPLSHELPTASSSQSKKKQNTRDGVTTTEMNIASLSAQKTTVETADTTHRVASPAVSVETEVLGIPMNAVVENTLASKSTSDVQKSPVQNNETLASFSTKEKIGRLNGSRRNSMEEMLKGILDSADEELGQDVELQDINEAKLLASDEESDTTAGMTADDVVEEGKDSGTESMEVDVLPEKPFVVDAAKEREELYLREKLLKAQLLKKMEASNERLKLRKLERDIVSSRKDINRELTSLLSEMVKLSDLKVKMKTQENKVLLLREQLYAAEQQLSGTVNKIQTYESRRKNLTSRVIDMRKDCLELVKECRKHGQKVQENYQVPSAGAVEMKSKLVEVRNQNLVFRRENQKMKSLSPRKQAMVRKLGQQSATLAAANRVKRSFHLMGRRLPVTSGVKKIPSTPQQLKFYARKPTMNKKGKHFEKTTGYLTKHGMESPEDWDDESVFLLPRMRFKDILTQEEKPPVPQGRIPILPYFVYESPLNSIREHGHSDSSTPGLVRNLDPFVTLCYFELRAMCNSVKCAFQHLYRPAKRKEDSQ